MQAYGFYAGLPVSVSGNRSTLVLCFSCFACACRSRILAILPAAVFITIALVRAADLYRRPRITRSSVDVLSALKLVVCGCLVVSITVTLALFPRAGWGSWATRAYAVELVATVS
jgi:ATP-binding cassette subfamily C (CFTR/MRP) protein 1